MLFELIRGDNSLIEACPADLFIKTSYAKDIYKRVRMELKFLWMHAVSRASS